MRKITVEEAVQTLIVSNHTKPQVSNFLKVNKFTKEQKNEIFAKLNFIREYEKRMDYLDKITRR